MSITLRPYQNQITDETRTLMRQGEKDILIVSPTGSGKTMLTANMLKTAANKGMTAFFLVHRRELINQSIRAFNDLKINYFGVIANNYVEAKKMPIQICSVQTLARRLHLYKQPNLIVFDECHHCAAVSWNKIYQAYKSSFKVGLTATPVRLDGTGLKKWFSKMVTGPSVKELIDQKYLVGYKLFAPKGISTSGLHMSMGDFNKHELALAADRPSITGDAIRHYQQRANNKRCVIFCVNIEHSKHVVQKFNEAGYQAEHVDGETDPLERDAAIRRFKEGKTKILSNVDLFGEGFDLPALEAVSLLRPTASVGLYLQQVGRALRTSDGKDCAIILDHAGNCERHGLPDEERNWSLEDVENKNKKSDGANIKICPFCYAAQFSGSPICKNCGLAFETKKRIITESDDDLVEVDLEALRRKRNFEQSKADSMEALVEIGKKRKYKHPERWAYFVFKARQVKKLKGENAKQSVNQDSLI